MKKLIVLVVLLALCAPAWAVTSVYPADGSGGTSIYPVPSTGSGGGAALANTFDWTLATGLVTSQGTVTMTGLKNTDSFDDGSIDITLWGNSVSAGTGTASITETTSLTISTGVDVTAAALMYYKQALNPRASNNWKLALTYKGNNFPAGSAGPIFLYQKSSAPTVGPSANIQGASIAEIDIDDAGPYVFRYWTGAGTLMYWKPIDNSWNSSASEAYTQAINVERLIELENDGTNLHYRIKTVDGTETLTYAPIAISSLRAEADTLYFVMGDAFSDAWYGDLIVTKFEHYGDYYTTSPVATMGQVTVGAEIKRLGLYAVCESGATVTWRYDIGAGFVTPASGTLSDLETALIGTSPATLNVEAAFNSNGTANCEVYADGASITTD